MLAVTHRHFLQCSRPTLCKECRRIALVWKNHNAEGNVASQSRWPMIFTNEASDFEYLCQYRTI
jgi:hypothetical protein